ncbi:hypothetical protein F4777DRAFT_592358 [Nemania sp. FL0916]|nr:hypothetical protein F4777DRAFT_592358 [Nemania sp. FL0916]
MKFTTTTATATLVLAGVATARPDCVRQADSSARLRREVPQEHSHEQFVSGVRTALNLNNAENVQDPVFALLGNAAAAAGAGDVQNLDCLQQHVADQAFTNAKAAGDVEGMTNALMFRAIERNTGKVGLASVLCNETATNPEIAALQQHQDPASEGAAALNKQITLDLAVQLASIGADPQLALKSGTFAPGQVDDSTGAGNSCDDDTDPVGCIFTQNLLVPDATAQEIDDAVAAAGGSAGGSTGSSAGDSSSNSGSSSAGDAGSNSGSTNSSGRKFNFFTSSSGSDSGSGSATSNSTTTTTGGSAAALPAPPAGSAAAGGSSSSNANAFSGNVGAAAVPVIVDSDPTSDRPFSVNGATFVNAAAAIQRACDVQKNACADAVNSGSGNAQSQGQAITVADCDAQQNQCIQANSNAGNAAARRSFVGLRARRSWRMSRR